MAALLVKQLRSTGTTSWSTNYFKHNTSFRSMATLLLGPPEIYRETTTTTATATVAAANDTANTATSAAAAAATGDAFVDLMVDNFNKTAVSIRPPMGLTENRSPTFLSSGNPCLDFFFHVVPNTPPESVIARLELAWEQDPLKALKLIGNLRGIRGTGKSDREGFYTAALWLYNYHPKTLAANVAAFAELGYFKDLLEILFRILEGADARELAREMGRKWKAYKYLKRKKALIEQSTKEENEKEDEESTGWNEHAFNLSINRRELKNQLIESKKCLFVGKTQTTREEKRLERAKRVVERYNQDADFQFLHEQISDLFAQRLRSDMEMFKSGNLNKLSLAGKWCPSLDSSFDRITLLCETIAKKVFPREEYECDYSGVEEAHYAYRVRDRLRKEVLVPLRKAKQLPEVYIGANDWGSLPYNRVASVAMKMYFKLFFKHDEERFRAYLDRVKTGEAKIAAGALLPHEIIAALDDDNGAEVAELQWKRMVDDMAKMGTLKNCLAISDVSGSMYGDPIKVSVALGILVSELSEEPWKGKLITFSEIPELHRVEGETLKSKTTFVENMEWNMNTDFQKVFDVILEVAEKGKLKGEEMIKRLFVFSDMEFDQASLRPWETDYEAIVRKYSEKGYGDCVPEIVFWNLRDSKATPVPSHQPGVALVSGFSKNLMKIFLDKGGILDPVAVMDKAISGQEYEKLVVVD